MIRKKSDSYLKVVEWSQADKCYVGTSPGLILGGVHGKNQEKVFSELCRVIEETVAAMNLAGKPLPPETANKDYSGKIALRLPPALHKKIAIRARQKGASINRFIQDKLEDSVN